MASAYYKVTAYVGTPHRNAVEVTIPLVGPAGPAGPAGTGLETLTDPGDTLYQGASTGQRLPIGSSGQVLKVVNGFPAWGNESGAATNVTSITVSSAQQLTAARNQRVLVNSTGGGPGTVVYLPATGNAEGDRLEVACVGLTSGTLSVRTGEYDFTVSTSMGLNEQRTFIYTSGAWTVGTVESHTHAGLGPTFASSAFQVTEPSGLVTNRLAFSLSDITPGATRTLTIANRSGVNVVSDTGAGNGSDVVNNIVSLTQAEYAAIVTPDAATLFLITDP